jgi:hypothetical protein
MKHVSGSDLTGRIRVRSCFPLDEQSGPSELDLLAETLFAAQESGRAELANRVLDRLRELAGEAD